MNCAGCEDITIGVWPQRRAKAWFPRGANLTSTARNSSGELSCHRQRSKLVAARVLAKEAEVSEESDDTIYFSQNTWPTTMADIRPGKSVFLGAPIQHASDTTGRFDDRIKQLILDLVTTLEAVGFEVFSAHLAEDFGSCPPSNPDEVTLRDFKWMLGCDAYIAVFPRGQSGELVRSDGMHVEIGWASSMKKPILIAGGDRRDEVFSHLIRGLDVLTNVEWIPLGSGLNDPELLAAALARAMFGGRCCEPCGDVQDCKASTSQRETALLIR